MRPNPRVAGFAAVMASVLVLLNLSSTAPARFVDGMPSGIPTPDVTPSEPPTGALPVPIAVTELRSLGKPDVALHIDSAGTVRSISGTADTSLGSNADEFVRKYAAAFGMRKGHTVTGSAAVDIPGGQRVVRYQQHVAGLPVLGGEVIVTTAADGSVRGALADTATLPPVATSKVIGAEAAQRIGNDAAAKEFGLTDATARTELWLHEFEGQLRPTYVVKFYDGDHDIATVLVDAATGTIRLTATERQTARERVICDLESVAVNMNQRNNYVCNPFTNLARKAVTRLEGGPASSSNDVNRAYDMLGAAHDYFKTQFGRDSYDGHGGEIRATVRACHAASHECPFENAFWDGYQFVFGAGWTVDDVVAHEYTHAVTDYASSLYYWRESGAINEALSDIFSEFIDLTTSMDRFASDDSVYAWRVGENIPSGFWFPGGGPLRSMSNPNDYGDPGYYQDWYWYDPWDDSDNGGVHRNSGVANRLAYLIAAGSPGLGITPLGVEKSGHLWYRIMHLLSSGANYEQLVVTAKAACRQLIPSRMTIADCESVAKATTTVFPSYTPTEVNLCDMIPHAGLGRKPASVLFADDMETRESADKWLRSDTYFWQFIPNGQIDYAYAAHGRGSLNGWTLPGTGPRGHGTYAQMSEAITVPAGQETWAGFYYSAIQDGTPTSQIAVNVFIGNDGGMWTPLTLESGSTNRMVTSKGYQYARADLSPWAGQQVKVRFQVESPANQMMDWYLDDFAIFTCDGQVPGAPQDAFGYVQGTDLKISWATKRLYQADENNPSGHRFDLTYSPAIPGAPEFYQPTVGEAGDARRIVTVPGADPNQRYEITVRVRLSNGTLGPATTIIVDPKAPAAVCPTSFGQLSPVFGGHRTPAGSCAPVLVPRRP